MTREQKRAEKTRKRKQQNQRVKQHEFHMKLPLIRKKAIMRQHRKEIIKQQKQSTVNQEVMAAKLRETLGLPADDTTPIEKLVAAVNLKLEAQKVIDNSEEKRPQE